MKVYRHKEKIEEVWQEFLAQTNGSLQISLHCLQRIVKRFPDLLEITENDFLNLIKKSKPLFVFNISSKQRKGIVVKNGKFAFAINFKTGNVITIFQYRKSSIKRLTLNLKRGYKKKKSAYYRPKYKKNTRKQIQDELNA